MLLIIKAEISTMSSELELENNNGFWNEIESSQESLSPFKCYLFLAVMTKSLIKSTNQEGLRVEWSPMIEFKMRQLVKDELCANGKSDQLSKLTNFISRMVNSICRN